MRWQLNLKRLTRNCNKLPKGFLSSWKPLRNSLLSNISTSGTNRTWLIWTWQTSSTYTQKKRKERFFSWDNRRECTSSVRRKSTWRLNRATRSRSESVVVTWALTISLIYIPNKRWPKLREEMWSIGSRVNLPCRRFQLRPVSMLAKLAQLERHRDLFLPCVVLQNIGKAWNLQWASDPKMYRWNQTSHLSSPNLARRSSENDHSLVLKNILSKR